MLQESPLRAATETARIELAIIVPTLNERGNIRPLLEKLEATLTGIHWEVVFVDDDSKDGTIDVLIERARADPRVRLIHRIGRRGLSSAVVEGILSSSAPYIAVMDADLQHDERLLPRMLDVLKRDEADLVVGSRYVAEGSVGSWSSSRQWISRFATGLSRLVMKAELADPMSGFFAMKRETFAATIRSLSIQGYKILLDIVCSAPAGLRIKELPFDFRTRLQGESKLDTLVSLEFVTLLLDKMFGRWIPAKLIMFAAVGGLGLILHLTVLGLLLHGAQISFLAAQTIATATAMTTNFFLNNIFTHRDRRLRGFTGLLGGLLTFYLVCGLGAVANVGVANYLFASEQAWWLAAIAGVLVGTGWNYSASSLFTWRK
jgi:dolichol-phosphate mannosyltransferase